MMVDRRVRIGNQSARSASEPTEPFAYALENGFDAFEWFPDKSETGEGWEEADLPPRTRHKCRAEAWLRRMRVSVHAPSRINPLLPGAMSRLDETLAFCHDVGAALLNLHLWEDQGVEAYADAVLPLIRRVADAGLTLAIENTPLTGPDPFNALFAALRKRRSPPDRAGMCLDVGHANLFGATRNDYLAYVDRIEPSVPIIHVHLHENVGDRDSHLTLFTGPADQDPAGVQGLADRLKRRNFSGSLILEQWPEPPSLLNAARDRLLRLFEGSAGP
ncbi:MAG: sugar phosphate isomerase/epimerase family protein [bacterium]